MIGFPSAFINNSPPATWTYKFSQFLSILPKFSSFSNQCLPSRSSLKNFLPTQKNLYSSSNALENLKHAPLEELNYRIRTIYLTIYSVLSRCVGGPCLFSAGLLYKTSPSYFNTSRKRKKCKKKKFSVCIHRCTQTSPCMF